MSIDETVVTRTRAAIAAEMPLPLPGSGQTGERWRTLTRLAHEDVVVGRLVEAHADAVAILTELGSVERAADGQWWGVWAAEPPQPLVLAHGDGDEVTLSGAKPWCSGAGMCTHALMTVRRADAPDERVLVAVDLSQPGVRPDPDDWANPGMARSATGTVHLDGVTATVVGPGSAYLERPGFWHGGCGVAACWLGGAEAVADRLRTTRRDDPHTLAHLGAVDAALASARWALDSAARELDADPDDLTAARIRALRVRTLVETAATSTLEHVGRALGAGPLCQDADHATAVADLTVYLRQSHAEGDLATLGGLLR